MIQHLQHSSNFSISQSDFLGQHNKNIGKINAALLVWNYVEGNS